MERRRGARVPARFWVQVSGVDPEPVLRRGDISLSGAYVEIDGRVGAPGSVESLWVAPHGREDSVQLLARVVRVVSVQDLWQDGPGIAGVAFEFLSEANGKHEGLTSIIRHILASRAVVADSVRIDTGFDVRVASGDDGRLIVRAMVLDTSWPLQLGDAVECEISASGRSARLGGRVVRAAREGPGDTARVEVGFEHLEPGPKVEADPSAGSISDAMDTLLEDVVFPQIEGPPPAVDEPMRGSLDRVRLGDLISFLESEGASGVLRVSREASAAALYMRQGRVVDVQVNPGPDAPRDAIILVCSFVAGDFQFTPEPVDRPDRVGASIAELLATPA